MATATEESVHKTKRRKQTAPVDSSPPVEKPAPPAATPVESTSTATTEEPPPPPSPPKQRRYDRLDQRLFLGRVDDKLGSLDNAVEPLSTFLPDFKITPTFRSELAAQVTVCRGRVAGRRQATADEFAAVGQMKQQRKIVYDNMSSLRQMARTIIIDPAGQRALALDVRLPHKTRLLIDLSRESLNACRQEPYITLLATVQIDEAQLDDITASITVLEMLYDARQRAGFAATQATTARNENFQILHQMVRLLTLRMNALLRTHPEIPRPMGFEE